MFSEIVCEALAHLHLHLHLPLPLHLLLLLLLLLILLQLPGVEGIVSDLPVRSEVNNSARLPVSEVPAEAVCLTQYCRGLRVRSPVQIAWIFTDPCWRMRHLLPPLSFFSCCRRTSSQHRKVGLAQAVVTRPTSVGDVIETSPRLSQSIANYASVLPCLS